MGCGLKKGFTLLELLCCMLILSILLSLSLVSLNGMSSFKKKTTFEKTQQELLKDLRNARVRAMTRGMVKAHFYDDGYILYDYSDLSSMIYKRVTYEDGIKFVGYKSTIPLDRELRFSETGTVSPYACSVYLEDSKGNSCTLSIKVTTFTIDFKK
jgi:prepilin-type N-terminal cleavage/methylation domain-containing protein